MAGGLAAGVIGPQTVIWTRDLVPEAMFAGSFLGQGVLALLSVGVVALLRPAPMTVASKGGGRPLAEIVRQPRFIVAVMAGLVSYGLMSFLMTAAPLAMVGCGHSVGAAALGIQWHVLAMFGPSFFTGRLIDRFGREAVTATGLVLIALAALVGLSGLSVAHFWSALILLGSAGTSVSSERPRWSPTAIGRRSGPRCRPRMISSSSARSRSPRSHPGICSTRAAGQR
jgi:cyanate permease